MSFVDYIRAVVGIEFGVKYSSFAYANVYDPSEIFVNDHWPDCVGHVKNPTVLKYDESFNLMSWGYPALSQRPNRRKRNIGLKPVENFLLYLSKTENKPRLPEGLDYKTAITDYLREMSNLVKESLRVCWPDFDFYKNVLIIIQVSIECDNKAKAIMRKCAYNAGLINYEESSNLHFITRHEAASIYSSTSVLREFNVISVGSSFMIVDIGADVVDAITRTFLKDNKLGDIIGRIEDLCGGNFVDEEFLKFLGRKVGQSAIDLLKENYYGQLQYMIKNFCENCKFIFTSQDRNFHYELDFEELCPAIIQYVKGSEREQMEYQDWLIEVTFEDIKAMFDPVIERILRLIHTQLNAVSSCKAILLIGDFSRSMYLQERIKEEFSRKVNNITIPANPSMTIVKGAVQYGLMLPEMLNETIKLSYITPRVFEKTYGIKATRKWKPGDPIERKLPDGMINVFLRIAKQGDEIPTDTGISMIFSSNFISRNSLDLFVTDEHDVKYCDSPEVSLIGSLKIDTPSVFNNHAISVTLFFDDMSIKVVAQEVDVKIGWKYETVFDNIY
ncbi:hypothetical protein GLOIN_2v1732694 [Rhizophagus clarus]|uniref:Actin-like ATPase domain-containing protein n=1 Tax=Rhizophagus clarus TaxID=94130 RepID=A0A8H3M3D9_9GLOM|nr:hypothetical protein GLOIN_2v1732694 [Rhizophagus clarus]